MVDADAVTRIIREVAQEVILPRFQRLAAEDIREKKGPNDLVTIADTEAEHLLTGRLTGLLAASTVVGEEGVAADPSVLDRLAGGGPVWIIDPVDGTLNFAKGRPRFGVIVALVVDGVTRQGWIHDPLADHTAIAETGQGAWIGDRRLIVAAATPLHALRGSAGWRRHDRLTAGVGKLVNQGSAAHDYLDLLDTRLDFAFFRQLNPWDHAAGVLMHQEAGGHSAYLDGTPYRPRPGGPGLLLAPSADSWRALADLLG